MSHHVRPLRKGVTLASYTGSAKEILDLAQMAEKWGFDDLWFADTGFPDALTIASAVALKIRKMRIGIAVSPIYTRTPAVLAATAKTLHELSDERFIMGLGTSSHAMVENWHGMTLDSPLQRMRETVALMRQIFDGDKTNFEGQTLKSRGYRQTAGQVPIYIAALRPKMLETAAEIGDGVAINLFPRTALAKIMEHIKVGAQRGQKDILPEIVCRYQVVVSNKLEEEFTALRAFLASYFTTKVYNRYLAWCGYPEIADELTSAYKNKDRERSHAAINDELIHQVVIAGDEAYCQERMRDLSAGGIDTHIVTCLSPDPEIQAYTYKFCANVKLSR
jgi:probable F420-dependent oxidoreductase